MTARAVALVTGASTGIGAELARLLARDGHALALVARNGAKLEALAAELTVEGVPAPLVIALDLTEPGAIDRVAAELAAAGAAPAILVNNAGYGLVGDVAALDASAQLGIVALNIRALLDLTLRFLPDLRAAQGKILNIGSIAAFFPGPGMAVYYASKAFVHSFTMALWQELRESGVSVTLLSPGFTATEFQARAGIDAAALRGVPSATARSVAEAGYAGLLAGRRHVVPGFVNKLLTLIAPLFPDIIFLPIISRMQQKRR